MLILKHFKFLEQNRNIDTAIQAQYDYGLVFLSVFLAVFSSYIAFLVARRIRSTEHKKHNIVWLCAGAFALGSGIWTMHFIGMLAYQLPGVVNYNIALTIFSVLPAVFSGFVILKTTYCNNSTILSIVWRSVLIGSGIGFMHYIGMAAMSVNGVMRYDPWLFLLSILAAIVLASIALWFKLQADRYESNTIISVKLFVPAVIMGCAISTMHYVGMGSMYVFPDSQDHLLISGSWSSDDLVKIISVISILLGVLLFAAIEVSNRLGLYQKIKESEENLAITLNSIGDAVITTDEQGLVARMNPAAEKLTGWSLIDAQGKHIKTIFTIVDVTTYEPIPSPIDKVLLTGETVYLSNHTTLIAKDGKKYQIADSAAPIRNDDNNILGVVLVFNDVTEQYQLREAVEKSKRNMQAIMDNSPAVIYAKDINGQFIFINKVFEKLFDMNKEWVIGKTNHELFPKDIADKFSSNDKAVLAAGVAQETEEMAQLADGLHTYLTVKFPLLDENGESYAVCGISTDITERKQQEEQLRRSQKMDALGKLTGGIAHDYNNMLGIILGYTDILKDLVIDQPQLTDYVEKIHHAGERGAALTKKLLTFTRKKSVNAVKLDINSHLQYEQNMLEKIVTARINLVLDLTDNVWPVYLDSGELEDAIVNMSINAMHAIDGCGQLTIQTRNESINEADARLLQLNAGDYVLMSVIDTGCGMNEKTKEKIFEPFYSTKEEKGTGLGLTQVYGFVGRSGATIKVFSELNQGTKFTLYFPRFSEDNSEIIRDEVNHNADLRGSGTVLVVDDEPELTILTSMMLSKNGYHVISANSARQALDILEKESIDLLLSDVIMPEMDGHQLASIVHEKYPAIKIQLASGFSDDRHFTLFNEALQTDLLVKPFDSKTLLQRVRELLA